MRKPKPFPKMIYRGEATLIVATARALEAARKDGWLTRDEAWAQAVRDAEVHSNPENSNQVQAALRAAERMTHGQ